MTRLGRLVRRPAFLVWLVAALVYVPGFWWGAPHATSADRADAWGIDDETPLGPLAEIHNIIQPKPDRNLGYPLMYSFMATAAYAPYLGYLYVTGGIEGMSGVYPFGLRDPVTALAVLTGLAHLLTALLAALLVASVFVAADSLWNRGTAILAAVTAGTIYPLFYYGRTGNVDAPMLAFVALAAAFYARIVAAGWNVPRAIGFGAAAGFAVATKEPAAFMVAPLGIALLLPGFRANFIGPAPSGRNRLALVLAGFVALGLGSGLFVEPSRYFAHLAFIGGRAAAAPQVKLVGVTSFPMTLAGTIDFLGAIAKYLADCLTLPGATIGIAAAVVLPFVDRSARRWVLVPLGYLLGCMLILRVVQLRYVMPLAFGLAVLAARALWLGWVSRRRPVRVAAIALTVWIVGLGALRGLEVTHLMIRDSRYRAGEWFAANTKPGDTIEYFGVTRNLPPLPAGVDQRHATEYVGMRAIARIDDAKVAEIRGGWAARQPTYVVVMPDYTSPPGIPYDATMPPQLYRAMIDGSAGYRLAYFHQTPQLLPWVRLPNLDYPTVNPPIRIFAPAE